jgi:hypothetical protein
MAFWRKLVLGFGVGATIILPVWNGILWLLGWAERIEFVSKHIGDIGEIRPMLDAFLSPPLWLAPAMVPPGLLLIWLALRGRQNGNVSHGPVLEIIFDPKNPAKRFWSRESPRDEKGNPKPGIFWEYRVAIRNNSRKTIRNVSVTVEHIGQNLPVRPVDAIFDKIRKPSCDLKPGTDELIPVIRWPIPVVQAGMLANSTALEYGPVKVTASGDDVPPTERVFQFDYQSEPMLFDSFETSFKSLKDAAAELYGEIVLTNLGKLTKDQCASEEEIWDAIGTMIINRGRVFGKRLASSKIERIPQGLFYSRLVGGAKIIRNMSGRKSTEFTDLQISRADFDAVVQNVKSIANLT